MPVITVNKNDFDTEVLSGYLVKSPPLTKRRMNRWQKRYFILRANRFLEYYKSNNSSMPKGVIDLRECIRMEVGLQFRKLQYIISIQTYQRLYYFNASSEVEMRQWAGLVYKVKEAMEGDIIDVSLNPMAPEIIIGISEEDSIHSNLASSSHELDQTLRTEMTRSRQYSRLLLKRHEKPLERRFLRKSFRYTGYYQQQGDKESSEFESEAEEDKLGNCLVVNSDQATSKLTSTSSHGNVIGLIQSVESLSTFFDIPKTGLFEPQLTSREHQPSSCDLSQHSTTSEGSSGYESMDSTTSHQLGLVQNDTLPIASRIKARKRTKPIPRPRQHRPAAGTEAALCQTVDQLLLRQNISAISTPQHLNVCAAGLGCYGNDGGLLSADNSEVTVNIPEGSIPLSAHPYIIQFEVFTDHRPPVPPTHIISPLVHIKSSDTTFKTPLTISIPHHTLNADASNCVVLATEQDLKTQQSIIFSIFPVTKATVKAKVQNGLSCCLDEDLVTISTSRDFQWFMLAHVSNGEAILRQCRMLVFHSRPKHGNFVVKVTIVEDYVDAVKAAVQAQTCDNKFSLDRDDITYQLKDWKDCSYISLDELEFGFSLLEGVNTKAVSLHGNQCWGSAEFVVKEMFDHASKMFICDVVIDTNHLSHLTNTLEIQPYIM